jgi:hypothetical protein
VDARGAYLVARFGAVHAACLAARRLQWAIQGLSEANPADKLTLSALVQAGEEASSDEDTAGFVRLESAGPGKILVTPRAAKVLDEAPGFPTRKTDPKSTELLWQSPGEQATRAADERALTRFIREIHGASAAAEAVYTPPEPTTLMKAPTIEKYSISVPDSVPRRRNLSWVFGLIAVAGLAAAGYFFYTRSSEPSKAQTATAVNPPQVTPTGGTSPSGSSNPSGQSGGTASQVPHVNPPLPDSGAGVTPDHKLTRREKEKLKQQEQQAKNQGQPNEKPQPQGQDQPTPPPQSGNCGIGQDEIPTMLNKAETARANGDYPRAKRLFQTVLNCERGNRQAVDGLNRVNEQLKLQGQSDQ